MTVKAHNANRQYSGATKTPLAPVRTVQVKCKPIGWLECTDTEFFRLLALHESGQIDLLRMPEYSTDDSDTDDDDNTQSQHASEIRNGGTIERNYASTGMVRQVVAKASQPMTITEIARKAQLSPAAVSAAIRRGKTFFQCAGLDEDGHTKLWMKKV